MNHAAFSPMLPRQKGVAAVEMAIVLPLLILVFTGMVEYGRLMWYYDALAKATRDAARHLADAPKTGTPASIAAELPTAQTMVVNAASAAGVKDLVAGDVTAACSPNPNCTAPVTVTVSVSYEFAIGGWVPVFSPQAGATFNQVTMSPHTTMRYMR